MFTRRHVVAALGAGAAALGAASRAHSEVVGKLTRMIVGFAPGGSSDVVARLIADQMKGYAWPRPMAPRWCSRPRP